ncbi:hypothetical protein [Caldiplasma sukawensis]
MTGNQTLESVFVNDEYRIYVHGPVIGFGPMGRYNRINDEIIFENTDKVPVATVRSTDPRTKHLEKNIALFTPDGSVILSMGITSTYGFLPKVHFYVNDENGKEYATVKFDSHQMASVISDNNLTVHASSFGHLKSFNSGANFFSNDEVIATVALNKTGVTTFDGYLLKINRMDLIKYLIPCVIVYLQTYGLPSTGQ